MQGNNKLRVFSGNTSNYIADTDLDGAVVQSGAVNGGVAASNLYNSLSLTTTLACTSLIDFVAQYNPSITFGQTTPIDTWITAVGNAIASKVSVDNIVDGTTTVGNATNALYATNVDVNNLNTGDNAIVNFQLGNGTAYNKTINNVGNANTVQNVNFSEEESAVFGNYIVPRFIILNDTLTNISTDTTINLSSNIQTGDILRFRMELFQSFKDFYVRVPLIPNETNEATISDGFSAANTMRIDTLVMVFPTTSSIRFTSISYYQAQNGSFSGGAGSCRIMQVAKLVE